MHVLGWMQCKLSHICSPIRGVESAARVRSSALLVKALLSHDGYTSPGKEPCLVLNQNQGTMSTK